MTDIPRPPQPEPVKDTGIVRLRNKRDKDIRVRQQQSSNRSKGTNAYHKRKKIHDVCDIGNSDKDDETCTRYN